MYGSPDGGFTIRDSDALLNGKMAEVAKVCIITVVYDLCCSRNLNKIQKKLCRVLQVLNLRPHLVRDRQHNQCHSLSGPFDMEGHLGFDHRYYFLDFSRMFPSEPPYV